MERRELVSCRDHAKITMPKDGYHLGKLLFNMAFEFQASIIANPWTLTIIK